MNKALFISRLMRERDKLELIVNQIGFTRQLAMPGVLGKWSIKDLLAHLLSYEQYMADRLEELQSAGEVCIAFTPRANEWNGFHNIQLVLHDFKSGSTVDLE